MSANRERSSSIMGIVVSMLLHGIFFAGCIAIDYGHTESTATTEPTEIDSSIDQVDAKKSKS